MRFDPQNSKHHAKIQKRAEEMRAQMRALPPSSSVPEREELVGSLPPIPRTRFREESAISGQVTERGRWTNRKIGVSCILMENREVQPFVELRELKSQKPLARWPLLPAIGGDNGPATVATDSWKGEVQVRQGKLTIEFHPRNPGKNMLSKAWHGLFARNTKHEFSVQLNARGENFYYIPRFSQHWREAG